MFTKKSKKPIATESVEENPRLSLAKPKTIEEVEAEFPVEENASKREYFERLMPAPPQLTFSMFTEFVWRGNSELPESMGTVEILKDSSKPGGFEAGMMRRVGGYDEEVTKVTEGKLIEYKVKDGMPTEFHMGRILFKPEENKTRVIWSIYWSPNGIAVSLMYSIMMQGYCNLALYRLEQKLLDPSKPLSFLSSDIISRTTSSSLPVASEVEDWAKEAPTQPEKKTIQWAARLQTGYEGNLTKDQEESLALFKQQIQEKDPETWRLIEKHPDTVDRLCLRFLRAEASKHRKFNIEKSWHRLADTLRFREQYRADYWIDHDPPRFDEFEAGAGETELYDNEGRLVIFTRAGHFSNYANTKLLTEEQWINCFVANIERRLAKLRENSKRLGYEVSASVTVFDMRGMTFASRGIIPFAKFINEVASKHCKFTGTLRLFGN